MTRSPLFNFVFGLVAGSALGAAVATHAITVRVEAANRAATAANEERIRQLDFGWRGSLAAHKENEAALRQRMEACPQ